MRISPGDFVYSRDQFGPGSEFYGILLSFGEQVEFGDTKAFRDAEVLDIGLLDTKAGVNGDYRFGYTSIKTAASWQSAGGDAALAAKILLDQGFAAGPDGSYSKTRLSRAPLPLARHEKA